MSLFGKAVVGCLALGSLVLFAVAPAARAAGFTVLTQFPFTDGTVNAVVTDDARGVVYLGGNFTTVGGQPRANLAAVNATTGALLPWNPGANGIVYTALLSNGILYVGGDFTMLGGATRNSIGALAAIADLSASSVVLTAFDPNATGGNVGALVTDGAFIYAGGLFSAIGGQSYQGLAKLSLPLGTAVVGWFPDPRTANNNGIGPSTLALSGTTLYAGGLFATMGGQARKALAAIDTATGAVTAFDPSPTDTNFGNQAVYELTVNGTRLYVSGFFNMIAGQPRQNFVALDLAGGTLDPTFNPASDGAPFSLAFNGNILYVGGSFSSIGGQSRSKLAALDVATGAALDWNPGANNTVQALVVLGGVVYIGAENCTTIGGVTNLPSFDFAAVTENAVPPVTPPNNAPSVKIKGKKKFTVTTSKHVLKGTAVDPDGAADIANVTARVGKKTISHNGKSPWSFRLVLKPGKNKVTVTATDLAGAKSAPATVTITRK